MAVLAQFESQRVDRLAGGFAVELGGAGRIDPHQRAGRRGEEGDAAAEFTAVDFDPIFLAGRLVGRLAGQSLVGAEGIGITDRLARDAGQTETIGALRWIAAHQVGGGGFAQ